MSFKPCLIIPIYNHKDTIVSTIKSLRNFKLPCILVDDGSDTDTQVILDKLAKQETWVQLCRLAENQGKGSAVMQGIKIAHQTGYTHALQIDADGQHDVADVSNFLSLAKQNPDALVYGQAIFDDSIPRGRLIARYITHFWVCVETLSFRITDTLCGFRVYPLESVHQLIIKVKIGQRMDFDTDIMVRLIWEQVPIIPVPTNVIYPQTGLSHFKYIADNIRISKMHTWLVFGMLKRLPWLLHNKIRRQEQHVHWSNLPERGASWGLKFILWVNERFGNRICKMLLMPVIGYFFIFAKTQRRESQKYLQKIYAYGSTHPKMAKPPKLSSSFQHFMEFGLAALDRISFRFGELKRNDVIGNKHDIINLARSGSGGIIIGSHLGNIELSHALTNDINAVKVNTLVFTEHAARFQAMLDSNKANNYVNHQLIQVNQIGPDTAIMLKEKIDNGELIVILADRTPVNSKKKLNYVDFLGEKAAFGQGAFILASLLECPVYLLFCLKKDQYYQVYFEHFTDRIKLNRKSRQQELQQVIQKFAKRLEYYCLQEPFQWFNFFDFWYKEEEQR